jgi:hypothetical protein
MKKQNQEPLLAAHKLITRFLELVCKNDSTKLSQEFNITMKIITEIKEYLDDYFDRPYQTLTPAPLKEIINKKINDELFFMPDLEEETYTWRISCRIFSERGEEEISGNFDLTLDCNEYTLDYLNFSC